MQKEVRSDLLLHKFFSFGEIDWKQVRLAVDLAYNQTT